MKGLSLPTRFVRDEMPLLKRGALAAAIVLVVAIATAVYASTLSDELPRHEQLANPSFSLAAVAYSADGREIARFSTENRTWVPYERISPHVINALIATEDRRFYRHRGIDVTRSLSAVTQTLLAKAGFSRFQSQGGSTITQQLARNLFDEHVGTERSLHRKLKEIATAIVLERKYSKQQIIELYLNTVQFGYRAYGIETAAYTFFGKPAVALSLSESATLVAMLKAITRYNPIRNPQNAKGRRDLVLRLMLDEGSIDGATFKAAREEPISAAYHSSALPARAAAHFAEVLRSWVASWGRERAIDAFGEGLRIYTTLDTRLQQIAEEAVRSRMDELQKVADFEWSREAGYYLGDRTEDYAHAVEYEPFSFFWDNRHDLVDEYVRTSSRYRRLLETGLTASRATLTLRGDDGFMDSLRTAKTRLEAGLVSIDPRNGQVRAWVGGRDVLSDWNDHVTGSRRQPGSAFKPIVYTAAIDNGWGPSYVVSNSPFTYTGPFTDRPWSPSNFGGRGGGTITLRRALATSNNVATARVITELITPSQVAFYARRMGIDSPMLPVASLGLGTSDVTLLELASAYATLAGGGRYNKPYFVSRIEDRTGKVLFEHESVSREAISAQTAFTVVDMLRDAVKYGTASRLRARPFSLGMYDLAGKTGTTQKSADGWFFLLHAEVVTGTWVGFNDPRITFRSQYWGQGAHNALLIAGTYFRNAVESSELLIGNVPFPGPGQYGTASP